MITQEHAINIGAAREHFVLDYGFITHHARWFELRAEACILQYDAAFPKDMNPSPEAIEKRSKELQTKVERLLAEVEIWAGVTFTPPKR